MFLYCVCRQLSSSAAASVKISTRSSCVSVIMQFCGGLFKMELIL